MNWRLISMVIGGLAYPPAVYYGMQNVVEKPQSGRGQVVIQPNTDPGGTLEIPRELRIKECPGGYQVPDSMPCPSQPSGIGALTGRFIRPTGPNDLMTIFGDQATKNPGLVFDKDGVAHFPRGINVDTILSGGTDLVAGKEWKGSPVNLGCSVTRDPAGKKAIVKCGQASAGVDVLDGRDGPKGSFAGCEIREKSQTATSESTRVVVASCEAGEILTGGGCDTSAGNARIGVRSAIPSVDNRYTCDFTPETNNVDVVAYAVCCKLN